MPGLISGLDLVKSMICGGEKAVEDFSHISGGVWFDDAPEYFLSTYVARYAGDNTFVLLEVSVDQTRKEAGASRPGRPAVHERRNGRFDVVLYWANGNPRAAVEIKSPIWSAAKEKIYPDIDRLCSTLLANRNSTFQFGVLLFYASVAQPKVEHYNATKRMNDLLDRIEKKAIKRAGERCAESIMIRGSIPEERENDGGTWSIASLVITRPGGIRSFLTK